METGKKDAILYAIVFVAMLALMPGCGKKTPDHTVSVIERTTEAGTVSVEMPAEKSFPRDEIPAGIEAKDIAAVITLSGETASELAPGPGDPTPNAPRRPGRVFVKKDGTVVAEKQVSGQIQDVQTPERSWAWAWWSALAAVLVIVLSWAARNYSALLDIVTRWFKK